MCGLVDRKFTYTWASCCIKWKDPSECRRLWCLNNMGLICTFKFWVSSGEMKFVGPFYENFSLAWSISSLSILVKLLIGKTKSKLCCKSDKLNQRINIFTSKLWTSLCIVIINTNIYCWSSLAPLQAQYLVYIFWVIIHSFILNTQLFFFCRVMRPSWALLSSNNMLTKHFRISDAQSRNKYSRIRNIPHSTGIQIQILFHIAADKQFIFLILIHFACVCLIQYS